MLLHPPAAAVMTKPMTSALSASASKLAASHSCNREGGANTRSRTVVVVVDSTLLPEHVGSSPQLPCTCKASRATSCEVW